MNPIVPLQLLNLFCRNGARVQATLLGKVYSSHIDILELVPVAVCDHNKVKTIDFADHARSLENLMTVYPNLQILGVAVTDLKPDINIAVLHTMYVNKESGFKPQGILNFPIILSVATTLPPNANNFLIEAYSFNATYRHCKELMDVTSFEKLDATLSLGDAGFEAVAPLFEAMNDQEKVVPNGNAAGLMKTLAERLRELKLKCESEQGESLKLKLREILGRVGAKQAINTEELAYLLDLAGLQKRIALKMNKFL